MTPYGIEKAVDLPPAEAVQRITEALKAEGFGVLTSIDIQETLRQKIGVDFGSYVILGACNPHLAYQALQTTPDIGLLLPCNVIVYSTSDHTQIAILDPEEALGIAAQEELVPIAKEAKERLQRVLAAV